MATKPSNEAVTAFDKRKSALELRRTGMDFDSIAMALGYTNRGTAYRAYREAMKDAFRDAGSEEQRQLEVERLDKLQLELWPRAMRRTKEIKGEDGKPQTIEVPPDFRAVERILKIIRLRAELLGLFAPIKHQVQSALTLIDRAQQQRMLMTEKGVELILQLEREVLGIAHEQDAQDDEPGPVRGNGQ